MIPFELEDEQARKIAAEYLIQQLILQKQYLDEDELEHYKWMIIELTPLREQQDVIVRFNNTWPTDITWGETRGRRW